MNFYKGSQWARWDLHVHTPYSLLNSRFGNPEEEQTWDTYLSELFRKAYENEIVCIGITDYFSIEGYLKLKSLLNDNERLKEVFADKPELIDFAKSILLLANIELRLSTFVGGNSVNYHVIFSDELDPRDIQSNFLEGLVCLVDKAKESGTEPLRLTKGNIERIGKKLIKEQGFEGTDFYVGIQNITVSHDSVTKELDKDVFKSKHLIVLPCDEDLSKVDWAGRDHLTRKGIIKSCQAFFTSNPSTVEWALGNKSPDKEAYLEEFGRLKPCIHGSDAHTYSELFKPDQERYCWIKSLPTFNGLLQILAEPEDRVRIQASKPDYKNNFKIIDYVEIEDEKMQSERIYLNDNLNSFIGGKSTGKSLLLFNIANAIDPNQVEEKSQKTINRRLWKLNNVRVSWSDGALNSGDGSKKIIYIPQGHLNLLLNDVEQMTEIDLLIQSVICQDENIKKQHDDFRRKLSFLDSQMSREITNLMVANSELLDSLYRYSEHGTVADIEKEIYDKRKLLQEKESKSLNVENLLEKLTVTKQTANDLDQTIQRSRLDLGALQDHILMVDRTFIGRISSETIRDRLIELCDTIDRYIEDTFNSEQEKLILSLSTDIFRSEELLAYSKKELEEIQLEINANQDTALLTSQINDLLDKKNIAEQLRQVISEKETEKDEILNGILKILSDFESVTATFCAEINGAVEKIDENELTFSLQSSLKENAFFQIIRDNFDNRKLRSSKFSYFLEDGGGYSVETVRDLILEILKSNESILKGTVQKDHAIKSITQNLYKVNYQVAMENDAIEHMSPGKKALVLLRLLIDLSESEWPILIDQPEDDLDNRSIFDDLVGYIKRKKRERQIIVATHNANIVVGGDAEQVIIANQNGGNTPNISKQFEYRSGGIESIEVDVKSPGILYQQGVKDQICRILEGGERAFELRSKKYFSQ